MKLKKVTWQAFEKMTMAERVVSVNSGKIPYHVLYAQQFNRQMLDRLGVLATKIRLTAKSEEGSDFLMGLLSHKRVMLYFTQPSTRTFLSFCAACQILGMRTGEVRDTATSSELKGESKEDSIRTFSSYFDMIVMRSEEGGLAERTAVMLANSERPVPIISAGSGKDQHPTQALLDIYTLQRSFEKRGGIDGKTVMFVGDLLRGRTVRSLSFLLTDYKDVKQTFVAPDKLQIGPDILKMLDESGVQYELSSDFAGKLREADAVYMTRIQDEWDSVKGESGAIDTSQFSFRKEHLDVLKKNAVLLHPLPRRSEISTDIDQDPRAVYWRQMRNGMWIRAALMAVIFGIDRKIDEYVSKNG